MLRIHAHARWVALHNLCKHMRTGASRMQAVGPNVESASYFLCIYLLAHPLKTATTVSAQVLGTRTNSAPVLHTLVQITCPPVICPHHTHLYLMRVLFYAGCSSMSGIPARRVEMLL